MDEVDKIRVEEAAEELFKFAGRLADANITDFELRDGVVVVWDTSTTIEIQITVRANKDYVPF